ncbi:MAG: tyrosine--tRNA ligase [candidate division WOR-3 bacterium]|nr:tyrosine--tRNA ligase [candidate division WOR-3 bacterium]
MNLEDQIKLLERGCEDILPEEGLREKLKQSQNENSPLRVKLGIDASGPDIHLGFAVPLRKLKEFQEMGHTAVLIIGDFTGKIGDPTGRNKTRPQLTDEQIKENMQSYKKQVFKILDREKTEIRYNGEWLGKMSPEDIVRLTSTFTVARMLERDYFENRFNEGVPISIHEFLYPLFQAYDSVAVNADIELGGTDQKFNLLLGRTVQENYNVKPQVTITMPILEGTDGTRKMSKSYGNYIGITQDPKEMFGRTMSIPDELIIRYFRLTTDLDPREIEEIKDRLDNGENPRDIKVKLAKTIIEMYHSKADADRAEEEFNRIFKKGGIPDNIPEVNLDKDKTYPILKLLNDLDLTDSNSQSRRMIKQGAVKINDNKITDIHFDYSPGENDIIRVGKRRFVKIV